VIGNPTTDGRTDEQAERRGREDQTGLRTRQTERRHQPGRRDTHRLGVETLQQRGRRAQDDGDCTRHDARESSRGCHPAVNSHPAAPLT